MKKRNKKYNHYKHIHESARATMLINHAKEQEAVDNLIRRLDKGFVDVVDNKVLIKDRLGSYELIPTLDRYIKFWSQFGQKHNTHGLINISTLILVRNHLDYGLVISRELFSRFEKTIREALNLVLRLPPDLFLDFICSFAKEQRMDEEIERLMNEKYTKNAQVSLL